MTTFLASSVILALLYLLSPGFRAVMPILQYAAVLGVIYITIAAGTTMIGV
jgi:hypothetical protein